MFTKKILKVVSVFFIFVLIIIAGLAFLQRGDDSAPLKKNNDSDDYLIGITKLASLGIIQGDENGDLNPDSMISRAEFVAIICRILNCDDETRGSDAEKYTDVSSSHWASGYIARASAMGIIEGYGNGKFGPSDSVTSIDAVKILIGVCGYTDLAEAEGGYPDGYLKAAKALGIISERSDISNEAATRWKVAALTYNALLSMK